MSNCPPVKRIPECTCDPSVKCGHQILKYIQPEVAKSFQPDCDNQKYENCCDTHTIYNESYPDPGLQPKTLTIKPANHFKQSKDIKMDGNTTTKTHYPRYYDVRKLDPIIPDFESPIGQGKIDTRTTHGTDYKYPDSQKQKILMPIDRWNCPKYPVDLNSEYNIAFNRNNFENLEKSEIYVPPTWFAKSKDPFSTDTTYKESYMSKDLSDRNPIIRRKLKFPILSSDNKLSKDMSMYRTEYIYDPSTVQNTEIFPPESNAYLISKSSETMSDTTYRNCYKPQTEFIKIDPVKRLPILTLKSASKMDTNTTHYVSYPGHYKIDKQKTPNVIDSKILPNEKIDDQFSTTQKRDYIALPYERKQMILPKNTITCVNNLPNEHLITTARDAYRPLDDAKPAKLMRMDSVLRNLDKMESDTTQKVSYVPHFISTHRIDWKPKDKFKPIPIPSTNKEFETTQRYSFPSPGQFIKVNCDCYGTYMG